MEPFSRKACLPNRLTQIPWPQEIGVGAFATNAVTCLRSLPPQHSPVLTLTLHFPLQNSAVSASPVKRTAPSIPDGSSCVQRRRSCPRGICVHLPNAQLRVTKTGSWLQPAEGFSPTSRRRHEIRRTLKRADIHYKVVLNSF